LNASKVKLPKKEEFNGLNEADIVTHTKPSEQSRTIISQHIIKKHNKGKFSVDKICKIKIDDSYWAPTYTGSLYSNNAIKAQGLVTPYLNSEGLEGDETKRIFPWRPAEEQKLIYLYGKYPDNWAKIAESMPDHDKEDWHRHYIKIWFNKKEGKWSSEEEDQVKLLHKKFGKNWKIIAAKIPGRTAEQVKDKVKTVFKANKPKIVPKVQNFTEATLDQAYPSYQIEPEIDAMIENELGDTFEKKSETMHHFSDQSFKSKKHEQHNLMNSHDFRVLYEKKYNFSQGTSSTPHSTFWLLQLLTTNN
jgi:hypothetical protein